MPDETASGGTWKRDLTVWSLLAMSLGTVIGSGWLLLPGIVAAQAGPASVLSWILAGLAILVIALVYSELGAAWPAAGAVAKYPYLSHGRFTGHLAGWGAFVAYAIIPPAEAVAVIRYASNVWPALASGKNLTPLGIGVAVVILGLIALLNYVGVKYLGVFENWVTALKYIPIALFVVLLGLFAFNPGNFTDYGGLVPHGASGVLLGSSSTVFAYLGFRQALDFGAEAKNPGKNLPRAIIGTVLIATFTYALISFVLVGSLHWGNLGSNGIAPGNWSGLKDLSSPMYAVAAASGLGIVAALILLDGILSPNGPNASNVGTVPRLAYTMAEDGTMPSVFERLHPRFGTPGWGLLVCFFLEVLFLLVTEGGYATLIDSINVGFLVAYAIGPVSMVALRRTAPHVERPFTLAGGRILAPLAFVLSSLLMYWEGWPLTGYMLGVLLLGVPIYIYYAIRTDIGFGSVRNGVWLMGYLVVMALVSFLGSDQFGGTGVIPFGPDIVVVTAVALGFYFWGLRQRVPYDPTHEPKHVEITKTGPAPGRRPAPGAAQAARRGAGARSD